MRGETSSALRVRRRGEGAVELVADGRLVEPVGAFLGWLTAAGRSPNTVPAYAYDLLHFFEFLQTQDQP